MKYCFICVRQKGELEIQSLLLMASLKKYLKVNYELYVAIPTSESIWGKPDTDTLRQLTAFGVRFFYTTNEISHSYPIANKLGCFNVPTDADRIIFLDTDMILLKDFVDDPVFQNPLEKMLPYYNAGFIAIDSTLNFSSEWIKQCKLIDGCENIKGKRPYLDQITLPLVASKLGINCTEIDVKYNFTPRLQRTKVFCEAENICLDGYSK